MNIAKIGEWLGFAMIMIAFVVWLAMDFGYFAGFEKTVELVGLIGVIFWSLGYMQREKEEK